MITSPTGAVIRDIMHRLDARFPRRVLLWPVAVQGERAAAEVAAAIRGFNAFGPVGAIPRPDLLIVARGGGSIEDLMAFNEEIVVRAAAESTIPLISAVGHETDTTLIDFVADLRAPTPTAAAEMAVPVRTELLASDARSRTAQFALLFHGTSNERRKHLQALARALPRADQLFARHAPAFRSCRRTPRPRPETQCCRNIGARFEIATPLRPRCVTSRIESGSERVRASRIASSAATTRASGGLARAAGGCARLLDTVSHRAVLERGFALVRGADGTIRRRAAQVKAGETLSLFFADGTMDAKAEGIASRAPKKPKGGQGTLF